MRFTYPLLFAVIIASAAVVFQIFLTSGAVFFDKVPKRIAQRREVSGDVSINSNNFGFGNGVSCAPIMDLANYRLLTDRARKYDQIAFGNLAMPRLRFHFDELHAPHSPSRDSSAMIMLFMFPLEEDRGQSELIDTSVKVWFGNNAADVATIDIAEKSLDEIRKNIFKIIQDCEYTIIRFKNAELKRTSEVIRVLQDVRSLSYQNNVIDGSKAVYFFEYAYSKNHIHKEEFSKLLDRYRDATGNQWHKYFDTVELVQNMTHVIINSTFDLMLGSRMRVSVIPFLPIPHASVKEYLHNASVNTLQFNTIFSEDEYLKLIWEQNPGIKVYKYMDDTNCNASPLSLPCLRTKCDSVTCSPKIIQLADNSATCTCT